MPHRLVMREVREGLRFVRENDLGDVIRAINSRNAHPVVQFVKYGICGVAAVIAHNSLVYLFGIWIPFAESSGLGDAERSNNQMLANLLAFPFGNAVAYATNAVWVFHGGRHSRLREFAYFTIISLVSFLAGLVGGPLLVRYFGISEHLAQLGFVVTSALVNFVCRKFFVFNG